MRNSLEATAISRIQNSTILFNEVKGGFYINSIGSICRREIKIKRDKLYFREKKEDLLKKFIFYFFIFCQVLFYLCKINLL